MFSSYDRFLQQLEEARLDGFLVTHPPNLRYLFQFTGSLAVGLVQGGEAELFVDSRYAEQAQQETGHCSVRPVQDPFGTPLQESFRQDLHIGIEGDTLTYTRALSLLSLSGLRLKPTHHFIEGLRRIKSVDEVEMIRQACTLARQALSHFFEELRWGISEIEAAGLLEYHCRLAGSEGTPFETIVASGPRSALPHGLASRRKLQPDEPLLIDFGVRLGGYCSDLTRVRIPQQELCEEIRDLVAEAQGNAIRAAKPGISAKTVDAAARQVISASGYGNDFGHSTGHGLGLDIHESPRISPRSDEILQAGMVFTVEPGIYLPDQFGIRLEDVVHLTDQGPELLSREWTSE